MWPSRAQYGSPMHVPIREFKAHLSRYLAQARAGQVIEVTADRKVVARVSGVPAVAGRGIPSLIAAGAAEWGGGKPAGARIELAASGPAVSTIVIEDRG